MGIDVHRGTDIRVSEKLLHFLGRGPVGQKITCEGVTEHMKMKIRQALYLIPYRAAYITHRRRRLYRPVGPETNEVDLSVVLRHFLRPLQTVYLIVTAALLLYLLVVVQAVKLAVLEAVLTLLGLCRLEDRRQRVAEVHCADIAPLGRGSVR